jgi:hypothetical protein
MRKIVPARVTVIAILHFVFGGLGVVQGICAGGMMASGMNQMLISGGPQGTRQRELFQEMQAAIESAPGYHLSQYTSLAGDLLISIIMIVSGVGLLRMQPWGRSLSILYATLSIALKIFALIYALGFSMPAINKFIEMNPQSAQEVQLLFTMMRMITIMTPIFLLLYMIYPAIVLIIMLMPSTKAAFYEETAYRDSDDLD